MLRITVTYVIGESGRFDLAYYTNQHAALVRRIYGPFGLKRFEVDDDAANRIVRGHLVFPASDSLMAELNGVSVELAADAPNYTDVRPTVSVASIVYQA